MIPIILVLVSGNILYFFYERKKVDGSKVAFFYISLFTMSSLLFILNNSFIKYKEEVIFSLWPLLLVFSLLFVISYIFEKRGGHIDE